MINNESFRQIWQFCRRDDPATDCLNDYFRSGSLSAHAHRHERHDKVVVSQMN